MSAPTTHTECSNPTNWGPCLHALAGGWIRPNDLCPECTHTFMRALDAAVPNLEWHLEYRERAQERAQ
jgi:hypothetical protein